MTSFTKLIANLALDAAALGYEDSDIRFAVMMASHVTNEDLIRDYFERQFPREWPPQQQEDPAADAEARRAKKAAKRRRYRANRAAAKRAAAAGTSVFNYAEPPEEQEATDAEEQEATDDQVSDAETLVAPPRPSASDAETLVAPPRPSASDAEADQLLSALFKLAMAELGDDEEEDDCDCHFCDKPAPKAAEEDSDSDSDYTDDEEEQPAVQPLRPAAPLPDVQKLTYKDAQVQSSVIRLKDGRVMEVRRNQLTGSAIPDRQFWGNAEAWRASLPSPNAPFDEDGVYISAAYTAAEELREAEAKASQEAAQKERVQTIRERLAALKAKRATAS
jgi:hypothetical protein